MGIIKAATSAVGGTLGDQFLEAVEPLRMTNETIMTTGVVANSKNNKGASSGVITDGSLIKVGENQTMLLVDGGKIVDYSAEPGYYKVSNENAPSMYSGDFGGALSDAFNRFKFGGSTPYKQTVFYINTAEIADIPFGTTHPITYFDNFYNSELSIRSHGYYSVKIINPIKFYTEMGSNSIGYVGIEDMKKMFLSEFLTAFQTVIGKMAVDGVRISHLASQTSNISDYMRNILDSSWNTRRGMEIVQVGISSISYDDDSKRLINIRNEGAMLEDPSIRTAYVQGAVARGIEAAGSNAGGATTGFMGVNMGMAGAGEFVAATGSVNNAQQAQATATTTWDCTKCSHKGNVGKFCSNCGQPKSTGSSCAKCGAKLPENAKFCPECGNLV